MSCVDGLAACGFLDLLHNVAVFDFSNGKPNPYHGKMKQQIKIRIEIQTLNYFKEQAEKTGIPYQQRINFYLSDCAKNAKELRIS
ncbi:antitoxin [Clostridia bacterium]|nr:antitoxin [Clostridia bacterium]